MEPLSTEWRYTVTVPEGFVLRALPEDKSTNIGPATFTQHYETDNQGNVKATLRFETTRPRYSSHDTLALYVIAGWPPGIDVNCGAIACGIGSATIPIPV